jgi:ribosomal protein S20/cytochrome c-type biogenesis protein CcmH/NrfF
MTISNAVDTFENVLADTRKFAGEQGLGAGARANWLIRVVRGAANGALDTVKRDKDGNEDPKGIDHAHKLYEAYTVACSKKNIHNAKTVISKASNLRKAIELGVTRGDDAIAVMNDATVIYGELSRDENVTVHPPFEAYNLVVRRQLESATRLGKDEIRQTMTKEAADRDAASYIRAAVKSLEKACQMDDTDAARNALEAAQGALAWYAAQATRAADMAALAELQAKYGVAA